MEDELIKEFLNESREHLATIEADLLAIEEAGANPSEDLVNKVFRAAHSIKGGSGFFGLVKVKELAHKAETVLDMLRSRKITSNAEVTNVLLAAFDKLREMINNRAERENADIGDLVLSLTELASSYLPAGQKAALSQNVTFLLRAGGNPILVPQVDFERVKGATQCIYCVTYDLIHDIENKGVNILQMFRELEQSGEVLDCAVNFEAAGNLDEPIKNELPLRLIFATTLGPDIARELLMVEPSNIELLFDPSAIQAVPEPAVPVAAPVAPAPAAPEPQTPPPFEAPRSYMAEPPKPPAPEPSPTTGTTAQQSSADETLRVSVSLLETLMNLAGELVLSRNQLRAAIVRKDSQLLSVADQRFNQVTSELQEAIMQTRLQPIGNVFAKFPRVVRDLANSVHKEILLDIQGKDVALDRSLIEGLSDPLTHMVRNAIDHGIESPDVRLKAGKKSQGTIRIEARHEAGQVVVEIADDGKGIDPAKVARAALTKGLITEEKLREMSDQDKVALVMLAGLSTAEKITDLSGRGVGMDVVKTNLERLGGKIEIKSEIGKGSLFRIKLPLTLAIIPSLIVSVGRERFAIPQINVEELLQIRPEDFKKRIEIVSGVKVLLLRDKILPLVHLDALIGVTQEAQAGNGPGKSLAIAVVTTGTMEYGVVVSGFHETEEIVVKPLGRDLKGLREYAGATILGDGTVALILDIAGMAAKAEFVPISGSTRAEKLAEEAERTRLEETQSLLLFHNTPREFCAIPLDTVLRIERTTPDRVELAGGRRTIQYRGASLPLVTLSDSARVSPMGDTRDLAVIIASVRGREVGLLGAMPVDVVETKAIVDQNTHRQTGIAGSIIIREQTTLITDLFELVDSVYPEWNTNRARATVVNGVETVSATATDAKPTILLAEDSDFFRAQVKKYLVEDGFTVIEAPDGLAAWELLEKNQTAVKLVLTDVEMPRWTGLDLARHIRADARFAHVPLIALSSLAGDEDVAKGKAAGIDHYLVKLDRDTLLKKIESIFANF